MVEFVTPIIEPTRRYYRNTIRNNNSSNNSNESISGSRSCIVNDGDNDEHHRMLSPGERIQLYLGSSGLCYHIILNHNDGITQWQTQASTSSLSSSSGCDDIPPSLVRQFYNMRYKNRYVTHFAINQTINGNDETYFVRGCDGNGTNDYYWSDIQRIGSGAASSHVDMIPRLVALGMETTIIVYENKKILQLGYHIERLWDRMKRVKENGGIIYCLRLYQYFHNDCYFIRDSEGCEWNMFHTIPNPIKLLNNLNKNKNEKNSNNNDNGDNDDDEDEDDDLIDVILAKDGSWIILRKTSYTTSNTIAKDVIRLLHDFYWHQKDYSNEHENYIEEFVMEWERANNTIVEQRQLSEGSRVTIVEKSSWFGDAIIVATQPAIWIRFTHSSAENLVRIDDAATILPYYDTNHATSTTDTSNNSSISNKRRRCSSSIEEQELATANDEYENTTQSLNRYLCTNYDHRRLVSPGEEYFCSVISSRSNSNNNNKRIDPFQCFEKIDVFRLINIHLDFLSDSKERGILECKMRRYHGGQQFTEQRKVLERCEGMELLVSTLVTMVGERCRKRSNDGFWTYPVMYERKDPLFPGRLFATGRTIRVQETTNKTSIGRTVTVQGMYSELRAPLVGSFGYDIDCANSDVRILCSLAQQLNVERLIPTLLQYRDARNFCLEIFQKDHNQQDRDVTIDEAKRLPTIIITGGSYNTWLRNNKLKKLNSPDEGFSMTEQFVFYMQTEVRALELLLMNEHKRFPWMAEVRERLEKESMSDDGRNNNNRTGQTIDRLLLCRIIQVCENEILTLMHQHISDLGWIVRTKIFDGLIIEPSSSSTEISSLKECLQITEQYCKSHGGWDIQLVEKPLHGLQDEPIPSLVQARSYLKEFQWLWNDK